MQLIITFKQGARIGEQVVSKCENPSCILPHTYTHAKMLWPQFSAFLNLFPSFPVMALVIFYDLVASSLHSPPSPPPRLPLSCYISNSFSTIKGIQMSPSSFLFLCCFMKLSFAYCGLILHISHSTCCFLLTALNPCYIQRTFALFCPFRLPRKAFFSPGCIYPYLSILQFLFIASSCTAASYVLSQN